MSIAREKVRYFMFIELGDFVFNIGEVAYIHFAGYGAYVHLKSNETVSIASVSEEDVKEAKSKLKEVKSNE